MWWIMNLLDAKDVRSLLVLLCVGVSSTDYNGHCWSVCRMCSRCQTCSTLNSQSCKGIHFQHWLRCERKSKSESMDTESGIQSVHKIKIGTTQVDLWTLAVWILTILGDSFLQLLFYSDWWKFLLRWVSFRILWLFSPLRSQLYWRPL